MPNVWESDSDRVTAEIIGHDPMIQKPAESFDRRLTMLDHMNVISRASTGTYEQPRKQQQLQSVFLEQTGSFNFFFLVFISVTLLFILDDYIFYFYSVLGLADSILHPNWQVRRFKYRSIG